MAQKTIYELDDLFPVVSPTAVSGQCCRLVPGLIIEYRKDARAGDSHSLVQEVLYEGHKGRPCGKFISPPVKNNSIIMRFIILKPVQGEFLG